MHKACAKYMLMIDAEGRKKEGRKKEGSKVNVTMGEKACMTEAQIASVCIHKPNVHSW